MVITSRYHYKTCAYTTKTEDNCNENKAKNPKLYFRKLKNNSIFVSE